MEKKSTPNLPYNTMLLGLVCIFFFFLEKVQTKELPSSHQKTLHCCTPGSANTPHYYAGMELQASQQLEQVRQNRTHVVDQYLYRMESLLVLKQPSCNVF